MSALVFNDVLHKQQTTLCLVVSVTENIVKPNWFEIFVNEVTNVVDKPSLNGLHALPGDCDSLITVLFFLTDIEIEDLRKSFNDVCYCLPIILFGRVRIPRQNRKQVVVDLCAQNRDLVGHQQCLQSCQLSLDG